MCHPFGLGTGHTLCLARQFNSIMTDLDEAGHSGLKIADVNGG